MTIDDDRGNSDDDDSSYSIVRRVLRQQLSVLKPIVGHLEQVECVIDATGLSDSTRHGLTEDAEGIARALGSAGHDLARLLGDIRRSEGG